MSRAESGDELEVGEILGERKQSRKGVEYLVRWKGFGPEEDSWEPLKNLADAKQAITEFVARVSQVTKKTKKSKSKSRSRSRSRSRGRTGSKSPARSRKSSKSPARSKKGSPVRQSRRSTTTKVTTKTETPSKSEVVTQTVTKSPGRMEQRKETVTHSFITESKDHVDASLEGLDDSEPMSLSASFRGEPASVSFKKKVSSTMRGWLNTCCAPLHTARKCCNSIAQSDYPAIIVFVTITIVVLSFVLERNVNFEKVYASISGFFVALWAWLKSLVPQKGGAGAAAGQ